jgi:hypothetical protein
MLKRFSLATAYLAVREGTGLGDAPGATNAWLVSDTDKTVRQVAHEVRAADRTRTRLGGVPQSLPQSLRPPPESSNRPKTIFANVPS